MTVIEAPQTIIVAPGLPAASLGYDDTIEINGHIPDGTMVIRPDLGRAFEMVCGGWQEREIPWSSFAAIGT